jgi:hypothetical protein
MLACALTPYHINIQYSLGCVVASWIQGLSN